MRYIPYIRSGAYYYFVLNHSHWHLAIVINDVVATQVLCGCHSIELSETTNLIFLATALKGPKWPQEPQFPHHLITSHSLSSPKIFFRWPLEIETEMRGFFCPTSPTLSPFVDLAFAVYRNFLQMASKLTCFARCVPQTDSCLLWQFCAQWK